MFNCINKMEKSLAATIEEIKLQEQNAEIKLRENRDCKTMHTYSYH